MEKVGRKTLRKRIHDAYINSDYTAQELADAAGVARRTIFRVFKGRVSDDLLFRVGDLVGVRAVTRWEYYILPDQLERE